MNLYCHCWRTSSSSTYFLEKKQNKEFESSNDICFFRKKTKQIYEIITWSYNCCFYIKDGVLRVTFGATPSNEVQIRSNGKRSLGFPI
jgi:hypothetical protein